MFKHFCPRRWLELRCSAGGCGEGGANQSVISEQMLKLTRHFKRVTALFTSVDYSCCPITASGSQRGTGTQTKLSLCDWFQVTGLSGQSQETLSENVNSVCTICAPNVLQFLVKCRERRIWKGEGPRCDRHWALCAVGWLLGKGIWQIPFLLYIITFRSWELFLQRRSLLPKSNSL